MSHAVMVSVQPALTNRNRLTTAFRFILVIPHVLLVGAVGVGAAWQQRHTSFGSETGVLGAVAFLLAVVSWFTILIGHQHIPAIRQFTTFYMRWRVRALAYLMLLRDEYPPFGDAPYPAAIEIADPATPRDRVTVALRIILAIPHLIALVFLVVLWWLTSFAAWLV